MTKYIETILAAAFFGAALFVWLYGRPISFNYDPEHFMVLEIHLGAIILAMLGAYYAIGVWAGNPEMRGTLCVLTVLALLPTIVKVATAPFSLI
jgi:hypothetical protein